MINIQNIICGYEKEVVKWVGEHYKKLGYEKIIVENKMRGVKSLATHFIFLELKNLSHSFTP